MNNDTTFTIANDDNSIDININSAKQEATSTKTQKTEAANEDNIFNLWNWRIETDTAELFIGMFG